MRLEHPIFHTPLAGDLDMLEIDTPKDYSHSPFGKDLPARLQGWKVHERSLPEQDPGLVLDPFGFEDSPDAEWISSGVNTKGPNSIALGRQGNFFHWGFFGDPDDMTPSARRVFLNTICYMRGFDGQSPIVARRAPSRERVLLYMNYVRTMNESPRTKEIVEQLIPLAVREATELDADRMTAFYIENMEFLDRVEGQFRVDEDARALGLSNRKLEMLDWIASQLNEGPSDPVALRLLSRYVPDTMAPEPAHLASWLEFNRSRLFFSDVGGFHWYLPESHTEPVLESEGRHFRAEVRFEPAAPKAGELFEVVLAVAFDEGWHSYSPASKGGFPMHVVFDVFEEAMPESDLIAPRGIIEENEVLGSMELLEGRVEFRQLFRLDESFAEETLAVEVSLGITVCDALSCLPPQRLELDAVADCAN